MIELFALNSAMKPVNPAMKNLTPAQAKKHQYEATLKLVVMLVVWVLFWVWAIMRALRCSSSSPDSRAVHFLFATTSPLLYILLSYAVPGFCRR